ncbi:hypothetical protein ACXX9E_29395 [Pseudomonas sp. GNP014]
MTSHWFCSFTDTRLAVVEHSAQHHSFSRTGFENSNQSITIIMFNFAQVRNCPNSTASSADPSKTTYVTASTLSEVIA